MRNPSTDHVAKIGEYLSRGVMIDDPAQVLPSVRKELAEWEDYWARAEKKAAVEEGEESPAAKEYNQIRRLLRFMVAPRLEEVAALSPVDQVRILNQMTPFDTEGGLRDFMIHFFQVDQDQGGELNYVVRDPFERELYVLHDLYKVKKTQEVISHIGKVAGEFPSIFSGEEQTKILSDLDTVMDLMFDQALPPEHRAEIREEISSDHLSARALLQRREEQVMYLYPHVREKYDYRRFFFLIYFKDGLKAKLGGEEREFKYDFTQFQTLKREYLIYWLNSRLKGHSKKMELYEKYQVAGKSLRQWMEERPEQEAEILGQMSAPAFNQMVEQINDGLPNAEQIGFEIEAEHFGFFHELKKQLIEAVEFARAPIQNLRKIVQEPAPPPPEPEPVPEPEPEEKWEVNLLKKGQVGHTFLLTTSAGYAQHLSAIRVQLGGQYREFADYTSNLLGNSPESASIRRRTPKHEWTISYHLKHTRGDEEKQYLLILGAEAKAQARGMGYTDKEQYKFSPYYVLAAAQPVEGLGQPVGDRQARGKTLAQYDSRSEAVGKFALELLEIVKEKTTRKKTLEGPLKFD